MVSSLNALIEDRITKLRGNVRMVKGTDNLKTEDLKGPPQILSRGIGENRKMFSLAIAYAMRTHDLAIPGSSPVQARIFWGLLFQLLKLKANCEDHKFHSSSKVFST